MAKATIQDVPQVFIKNPKLLEELRQEFGKFYDQENKPIRIYDSQLQKFNERIHSPEINIDPKLTPKELGIKFEEWFELLSNPQTTITEVPRPEGLNNTTLTSDQLENLGEFAERRDTALKQSREKATSDVVNTQARLKEIYDQQRIIQEQIKKAQELQPKFVGKKVYATVEQQEFIASLEAQKSFETLTEYANYQETRTDLINQLTESVQLKTNTEEIIARTIAVQLVNNISDNKLTKERIREVAIEEAIEQSKDNVLEQVLQKNKVLVETAKKGAVLEAENIKGSVFLTREIAENILPLEVVEQIYGPKQIRVVLSSVPNEQTTHEVDLEKSIRNYEINLKDQSKFLDTLKEGGVDRAKNIFRSQLYSNVNTYLAKAPKGSALGKIYSSDAVKAILTQGSPSALELKYFGKNPLLQTYFKYSPESMPYFRLFAEVTGVSVGVGVATKIVPLTFGGGAVPITKIAYIQRISPLRAPYTLGKTVGDKFAVGLGKRAATQAAGKAVAEKVAGQVAAKTGLSAFIASLVSIPIPGANIIVGAIAWLGTEILSKAKVLWQKHKDKIKPVLAVGVTITAIRFFGIGPGLGIGTLTTFGLMGTAGLATLVTGAFGVLGFIGRSIGVTVATPVIVTLLVLPPLVAFIMLVINNSAYVVPPSPLTIANIGKVISPYIDVKKEISKIVDKNGSQISYDSKNGVANDILPITVTYKITITAKKSSLTNIVISEDCRVRKENGSPSCPSPNPGIPNLSDPEYPTSISPTQSSSFEITMKFTSPTFTDSRVTNTINVTADTAEASGVSSSGSASLRIGNPPEDCPSGWPVYPEGGEQYLRITQGPHTHNGTHDVIEAIDIYPPLGNEFTGHTIMATHGGNITIGSGGNYGTFVDILTECTVGADVVEVTTRYAHLSAVSVSTGQIVSKDQIIGLGGSSGPVANNAHLHYEFRPAPGPIPMKTDYIPLDVPSGCSDYNQNPACNIQYK